MPFQIPDSKLCLFIITLLVLSTGKTILFNRIKYYWMGLQRYKLTLLVSLSIIIYRTIEECRLSKIRFVGKGKVH